MSASTSRQKPSKPKAAPKKLAFWCDLQDGHAHLAYRTEMMKPARALQNMRDVVMEMRVIMGLGKIYGPVGEPQWLSDAVDAEMARIGARKRPYNVDEE